MQDLSWLATRYLEPLKEESFLSDDDMQQLFGNIQDIIRFQQLFLDELEQSLEDSDDVKVQRSTYQLIYGRFQLFHSS